LLYSHIFSLHRCFICIKISSGTTVYSLFLIGRSPSLLNAIFISFLLSVTAGISEELFFRGFVYQAIEAASSTPIAVTCSAGLFGIAHYPLNISNALLEALLGGAFSVAYGSTGNNIAVPIIMHTVYDFFTIFAAWLGATNRLENVVKDEGERMRRIYSVSQGEFDILTKAVFLAIDKNNDGRIDVNELNSAIQIQK